MGAYRAASVRHAGGFTYLGMVILVATIGLVGAATLKTGSLLQRAAAEQELLDIGAAFSDALQSYAAATPRGQSPHPPSLQELLKDPRYPGTRRHLRKVFVDPLTGKAEWGILYLAGKSGVIGVYSLSEARPLKIANFDARFAGFENKRHLSEWKFMMGGQGAMTPPPLVAAPVVETEPEPVVETEPEPEAEPNEAGPGEDEKPASIPS